MKFYTSIILIICIIFSCVSMPVCAAEIDSNPEIFAAIVDENGTIIENLEVSLVPVEVANASATSSVYRTVTYTARSSTVTSGVSNPKDGVTVTLSITWNDFLGTNNQLVSVSGSWAVGDETISNRYVSYTSYDLWNNRLQNLTKYPTSNSFIYEPTNFTGYSFFLYTEATINSTSNDIVFYIST